eukprot:IDg3012t1
MIQSALNSAILPRLGNRCPLEVFTGHPQDGPLRSITATHDDSVKVHTIEEIRAEQILRTNQTLSALESMHRDVQEHSSKKRKKAIEAHNAKTHVQPVNFSIGDFVLRGVLQRQKGSKVALKWHGPFKATSCR